MLRSDSSASVHRENVMAERKSVNIEGFKHANPIPNAARIGNLVVSGAILGRDSTTGEMPPTVAGQCALVFRHMRSIVEAAGGTPADIIKVTVWLKDPSKRDDLNAEWLAMFPDPASRPARHTLKDVSDGPQLVQCDFMAVL
jgi:enamine deaminase RidA (YjgF/YER057c/UK114 family)